MPGSVIATKCRLAMRPRIRRVFAQKYACSAAVSAVVPDLLLTTNRVVSKSRRDSTRRTASGTVPSRTMTSGEPAGGGNRRRKTSTHRLDPPIPSRTTWRSPSPRASRANDSRRGTSRSIRSGARSQPRRFLIERRAAGAVLHRDGSPRNRRWAKREWARAVIRRETAGACSKRWYVSGTAGYLPRRRASAGCDPRSAGR